MCGRAVDIYLNEWVDLLMPASTTYLFTANNSASNPVFSYDPVNVPFSPTYEPH